VTKGSTPNLILDAAEKLFATKGFDGTSLRAITAEAGVNLAAVNYHFGSKEALIDAVIQRIVAPVNQQRLQRLDELEDEAGDARLDPGAVLLAFVDPALRAAQAGDGLTMTRIELVARAYAESRHVSKRIFLRQFAEVVDRFRAALWRALPELPRDELNWRLHFVIGSMVHMIHTVADPGMRAMLTGSEEEISASAISERLLPFLEGGISAGVRASVREDAR
jgi:AcrR family transcriptional regulator